MGKMGTVQFVHCTQYEVRTHSSTQSTRHMYSSIYGVDHLTGLPVALAQQLMMLPPKVFAAARFLAPTPRSTGLLPAPDPDLAAGRFSLEEDRRGGGPEQGAEESPSTFTQSLLLCISATLPSTSAACSFSDIPPMRLSCYDMRNPSKLGAPTRRPFITCSLNGTKCRSRIPPPDLNSVRAVRSRKASCDRFIAVYPHHRESTTKMLCISRYLYRLLQRVCCTILCTGDSTAVHQADGEPSRCRFYRRKNSVATFAICMLSGGKGTIFGRSFF